MIEELLNNPIISEFWKPNKYGMCVPNGSICHYTSSAKTIESMISAGEFWLSKSTVMNDFAEIKYGCALFEEIAEEESKKCKRLEQIISSFKKAIEDNIFGDIFILSFSENGNSRLLWDSYSRKSGYNIEIGRDFIEEFYNDIQIREYGSEGGKLKGNGPSVMIVSKDDRRSSFEYETSSNRVLYSRSKQIAIFKEIIAFIIKSFGENKYFDINQCLPMIIDFIPFFKDETLRDEEEYRLVIKIKSPGYNDTRGKRQYLRAIQHYRDFDNKLFPYIILKLRNTNFIKSVSVGYGYDQDLAYETMKDFIATLPYDIKVHKVNYSLRR